MSMTREKPRTQSPESPCPAHPAGHVYADDACVWCDLPRLAPSRRHVRRLVRRAVRGL